MPLAFSREEFLKISYFLLHLFNISITQTWSFVVIVEFAIFNFLLGNFLPHPRCSYYSLPVSPFQGLCTDFFFSTSIFRRSKLACLTQPCPLFLQGPKRVQEASLFWGFFRDRYCVQIFPSLLEQSGSASMSRCVNQSKCLDSVNRSVLLHIQLSPHVCMFIYHS